MRKLYVFGGLIFGVILFVFKTTFCNAASIALDPSAVSSFANGVNSFGSGAFNFSTMNPAMLPSLYDNINQNLYENFGYDIDSALWDAEDTFTKWATGQEDNPLNGAPVLGVETANWVADKMFQAGATANALINGGYHYFSQVIPQWGENAKQFFVGKIDEVTGKISQVGQNVVTKITAEGLMAYNQVYNNLVNAGDIGQVSNTNPLYSSAFVVYPLERENPTVDSFKLYFQEPIYAFCDDWNGYHSFNIVCPSSYISNSHISCDCYGLINNTWYNTNSLSIIRRSTFVLNGVEYTVCGLSVTFIPSQGGFAISNNYFYGSLDSIKSLISENVSPNISLSYDYSSSVLSQALKNQLDRLIGKYVDSLTLQRVNDIVSSIPIGVERVGDTDVPVAIPSQEVVDELTGVIDDAIDDSTPYEEVFEAFYDEAIDTPADPDPDPTSIEPYIEIDPPVEPVDTVSEVLTIPFKLFTSIFEPIFLVFGGSLFGLWLFIPVIILFIILIWALK